MHVSLLRSWPLLCVVLLPAWQAAASIGGSPGIVKPLPKVDPPIECRPSVKVDLVAQEAVPAVGEPALTLGDLQQLALAHHPAIGRADALLDAAHGRWVQAGLRKNPVAGYEATDIGEGGSAGKQGGFVSQEFVTAHKRQLAREVVQRAIEQRQHEREVVRRRVLGDVQARYLEAVFAQREFDLLSQLGTLTAREKGAAAGEVARGAGGEHLGRAGGPAGPSRGPATTAAGRIPPADLLAQAGRGGGSAPPGSDHPGPPPRRPGGPRLGCRASAAIGREPAAGGGDRGSSAGRMAVGIGIRSAASQLRSDGGRPE